jgi:hypothetical protein
LHMKFQYGSSLDNTNIIHRLISVRKLAWKKENHLLSPQSNLTFHQKWPWVWGLRFSPWNHRVPTAIAFLLEIRGKINTEVWYNIDP